jgi:hypothetical protein
VRASAVDPPCAVARAELATGSKAEGLAGTYRVLFIGTGGEARGRRLRGTLTLAPQSPDRERYVMFGQFNPSLRLPLSGRLKADLSLLGAIVPGRPDGTDPERPGVEVRQLDAVYQGRPFTEITLHVGHDGNRRDRLTLDGAYFGMRVRELSTSGFAGSWRSAVGMTTFDASGHYCAWRLPSPPAG